MSKVIMRIADGHPRQFQSLSGLEKLVIELGGQYHDDSRPDFQNDHLNKIIDNCSGTLRELVVGDAMELVIPERHWPSQRCLSLAKCLERIVLWIPAYLISGGPGSVPEGFLNFLDCKEALDTVRTIHILFLVRDKKPSELMLHGEDGWSALDKIILAIYPQLQTLTLEFNAGMGNDALRRRDNEYEVKRHMRSCFSGLVAAETTKVQVITASNVTIEIV
ncbi:hypothetical protein BJ165DRAFT_1611560 [Panaeolus papilionaceus]|nr:hypothetical protein BJ165DRAFT_1611560 [Panaeolus papilionaceus]